MENRHGDIIVALLTLIALILGSRIFSSLKSLDIPTSIADTRHWAIREELDVKARFQVGDDSPWTAEFRSLDVMTA